MFNIYFQKNRFVLKQFLYISLLVLSLCSQKAIAAQEQPLVYPCIDESFHENGAQIQLEFLWWTADEENLAYASKTTGTIAIPNVTSQIGTLERFDFDWNPGFRVTLGWDTSFDKWSLLANWTWYRNHTRNSISSIVDDPIGINAHWLVDAAEGIASTSASWELLLNLGSLVLSRDLFISQYLDLIFFSGVEGGWLNRQFRVQYGPSFIFAPDSPGTFNGKNKYWGVGPLLGLRSKWNFLHGFHISSKFSGSLLYGKVFKNQDITVQTVNGAFDNLQTGDLRDQNYMKLLPHLQFSVGLGWKQCIFQQTFLSFDLDWEANLFWNLAGFNPTNGTIAVILPIHTPLSTAGITATAGLQF